MDTIILNVAAGVMLAVLLLLMTILVGATLYDIWHDIDLWLTRRAINYERAARRGRATQQPNMEN